MVYTLIMIFDANRPLSEPQGTDALTTYEGAGLFPSSSVPRETARQSSAAHAMRGIADRRLACRPACAALLAVVLALAFAAFGMLALAGCSGPAGERQTQASESGTRGADGDGAGEGTGGASDADSPGNPDDGSSGANEVDAVEARLNGVIEDGLPLTDAAKAALSGKPADYTAKPKVVYQHPELESGCEIAALTSALQAVGFNVTATEIADEYLVVDGDYEYGYLASPYTDYGGGFPPGIKKAANAYLRARHSAFRAHDLTGTSFDGLTAIVDAGYPVLVWTTLENTEPNYDAELGAIDSWYVNEHCVTMYALGNGTARVADPLKGLVEVSARELASAYEQCGRMALYIREDR